MSKKEGNPRSRDITPIYLGDGKFQFKGPQKACYLTLMNGGSWAWVMDRGDGGIAFCMPLSDREIKLALAMLGVSESPRYTPETVKAAEASLTAAGALALARAPGAVQLAIAGEGVMGAASSLLAALGRAASAVAAGAAGGIAIAAIFHSPEVGAGSDRVPGRDVAAMFAMPASTLLPNRKGLEPGVRTADLAVRASLVMSNGELALKLLKTGEGGLPSAVPVLTAVRDAATGLDMITLPAVAGQPPRTILINPAPGPSAPSNTGNSAPSVPVTPVHTGTVIKPVGTIQITTTPVADPGGMQDFVYWQPDASGSGVQPVYVVLSNPRNRLGKVSGKGEPVGGDWLTNAGKDLGAPIPSQIADKLQGREFANFDAFREAFWKDVGRDPVLIKQFRENNKRNLMKGYSPFPIPSEQVGGRIRFELHHVKFIKDNGAIYDIDNIRVMTPKRHIEIHKEDN